MRKRRGIFISILSLCLFLSTYLGYFDVEAADLKPKRFNVVLVVDASSSLEKTDKDGLRYESIAEFLSLLANEGNNVGAIAFHDRNRDEDKNITVICGDDGKLIAANDDVLIPFLGYTATEKKMDIERQIRNIDVGGNTDVGLAVKKAVELLQNGGDPDLPSAILLFTDGVTELYKVKDYDDNTGEITGYEKDEYGYNVHDTVKEQMSHNMLESAKDTAISMGYSIYAIRLDRTDEEKEKTWRKEGLTDNDILKEKEKEAAEQPRKNTEIGKIRDLAENTGGFYEEVFDAEQLEEVFLHFYDMIYNVKYEQSEEVPFDHEGKVTGEFFVSGIGATEVNIRIKGQTTDYSFANRNDNEHPLSKGDLRRWTYIPQSETFESIKIIDPKPGWYDYTIYGEKDKIVKVDVSYDRFVTSKTELPLDKAVYNTDETLPVRAVLYDNDGNPVDQSYYKYYSAEVKIYESDINGNIIHPGRYECAYDMPEGVNGFECNMPLVLGINKYYVAETIISEDRGTGNTDPDPLVDFSDTPFRVELPPKAPIKFKSSKIVLSPEKEQYSPLDTVTITAGLVHEESDVPLDKGEYNDCSARISIKNTKGETVWQNGIEVGDLNMNRGDNGFIFAFKQSVSDIYTIQTTITDDAGYEYTESAYITVTNEPPVAGKDKITTKYNSTPVNWLNDLLNKKRRPRHIELGKHVKNLEEGEELTFFVKPDDLKNSDFSANDFDLDEHNGSLTIKNFKSGTIPVTVTDTGNGECHINVLVLRRETLFWLFSFVVVSAITLYLRQHSPKRINGTLKFSNNDTDRTRCYGVAEPNIPPKARIYKLKQYVGQYDDALAKVVIYGAGKDRKTGKHRIRIKSREKIAINGVLGKNGFIASGSQPVPIKSPSNLTVSISYKSNSDS